MKRVEGAHRLDGKPVSGAGQDTAVEDDLVAAGQTRVDPPACSSRGSAETGDALRLLGGARDQPRPR